MDIKARYLHLETRQTPMEIPYEYNRAVYQNSYPEQNQEFLNDKFYLTFRDLNVIDVVFDPFEEKEVRQRIFTCIRWDAGHPDRCVFISEDFEYLVQFTIDKRYPFSVDMYNDVEGYEFTKQAYFRKNNCSSFFYCFIYDGALLYCPYTFYTCFLNRYVGWKDCKEA